MDPLTLEYLMTSMPELRKKQRRTEELRGVQKQMEKRAQRQPQNYAPQVGNAVQQWQPDYGAVGDNLVGTIGGYLTGRSAGKAEDEYNTAQSQAVLQAAQQSGGGGMAPDTSGLEGGQPPQGTVANDAALRAYMTMIGGPEMAKALGGAPGDRKVRSKVQLENGNLGLVYDDGIEDTGMPFFQQGRALNIPGNKPGTVVMVNGQPVFKPTEGFGGQDASVPQSPEGGPPADGTTPPTTGGIAPPSVPGVTPGIIPSEYDKQRGTNAANIQDAPALAAAAAQREEAVGTAKADVDYRAAARQSLPKAQALRRKITATMTPMLKGDTIERVVGNTLPGIISSLPAGMGEAGVKLYFGGLKAGTPEADFYANHTNLTSQAFLQSYADALKGTGQVSNVEGLQGAQANLQAALYQSPEQYRQKMADFMAEIEAIETRLAEASNAPPPAQMGVVNPNAAAAAGEPDTVPQGRTAAPATVPNAAEIIQRGLGVPPTPKKRSFQDIQRQYGGK